MTTTINPTLAVAKDHTVHVLGCPVLAGSPRCTCLQPKNKKVSGIAHEHYSGTFSTPKSK